MLAVVVSALPAFAATLPAQFRTVSPVRLDGVPNAMVAGDLNGDAHLDVALGIVVGTTHAVHVLLGDGAGGFTRIADADSGGIPTGITAGRFDGDALPDLVVSELESDNLWFLRGRGDGTFERPRPVLSGHDPVSVLAVDFNGDQKLDIVQCTFAEGVTSRVNVLYGNGDGTFQPFVGARTAGASLSVAVADFDGDERLDAVAPSRSGGSVSVLLGREDGTLASRRDSPVGNQPVDVAAGDFDADGRPDVSVANSFDGLVSISLGQGNGFFGTARFFPVGRNPFAVAAADMNHDTHLDAVSANSGSSSVSLLLGDGDGRLALARSFIADTGAYRLAVADFDEDGTNDALSANAGMPSTLPASLTLLRGRGDRLEGVEQLDSLFPVGAVVAGDFDDDGLPDVATTLPDGRVVNLYFATPTGGFRRFVVLDPRGRPVALARADVNDDGRLDLITANENSSILALLVNRGVAFASIASPELGGTASAVAAGDFDGDGPIDLAAALTSANQVVFLHGNGDETFAAPVAVAVSNPVALAVGTFNDDAQPDLAVVSRTQNAVRILLSESNGFSAGAAIPVGEQANGVAVVDVDRDGRDDLVVSHETGAVRVIRAGDEGFSQTALVSVAGSAAVGARDVNGDQVPDLLVAASATPSVSVFAGNGDGTFAAPTMFVVTPAPAALAAGDFDGDGRYDIVATGTHPAVATNQGPGTARRGDGNGDQRVNAADFVAFAGTVRRGREVAIESLAAASVDANGDGVVNAHDAVALARWIFSPPVAS